MFINVYKKQVLHRKIERFIILKNDKNST